MEAACQKALQQIKDRRYQEYLLNDDRKDIQLYGIAFCKKDAGRSVKDYKNILEVEPL